MSDIEETSETLDSATAPTDAPLSKKRKVISLPFLLAVVVIGVGGYFGIKQIMYLTMLNKMHKEATSEIQLDPNRVAKDGIVEPIKGAQIQLGP